MTSPLRSPLRVILADDERPARMEQEIRASRLQSRILREQLLRLSTST
jgi:hypothetical protein